MTTNDTPEYKRPVSIAHLVFGLVFGGIATIWFVGQATGADLPRSVVGLPMVLIGAGVIGLIASLAGSRRRAQAAAAEYAAYRAAYDARYALPADETTDETTDGTTDDTVVLTDDRTATSTDPEEQTP